MSITFSIKTKIIAEVPAEAFDDIQGFDDILEKKTGKYIDLYGKTILYKGDAQLLLSGFCTISKQKGKGFNFHPSIKALLAVLESIDNSEVIRVNGE